MFKINKDLRRLGIVSVSALMLLGVGASAMGSTNTPVHAESNAEIAKSLRGTGVKYIDERTPEQKRDDARATAWANKVDRDNDIKDYESEGMTRSQAIAHENGYKKQKQTEESKEAKKLSKEQQKRVAGKSAKQLAKEQKIAMTQNNHKSANPVKSKRINKRSHRIANEITKLQRRLSSISQQIHHLV